MGTHEPYWQTNSSFSPPPSRWDFRFQSEGISLGSHDSIQYGSSTSSNSRESRNWMRGNHFPSRQYVTSEGVGPYFSSPSDISPARQWTPPTTQDISIDDYGSSRRVLGPLSLSPTMEGTSAIQDSRGSTSSRSDSSDYEPMVKSHSSHHHFSSRSCFTSKLVHPVSFPSEIATREAADTTATRLSEFEATNPQRERNRFSRGSGINIDVKDISEPLESDVFGLSSNQPAGFKCGLCEKFLSQRSPWSSRRIVRSGDLPIAGVLSCCHVFHADCLDQTTPKTQKNDPHCPLCVRSEEERSRSTEQQVFSNLRKGIPTLKPFHEDGPSRPWGCAQAGACVEGALHGPPRNYMLLLNRNRMKKNLSLTGNSGKEFLGKPRKSGSYPSQLFIGSVDHGAAGSSHMAASSALK